MYREGRFTTVHIRMYVHDMCVRTDRAMMLLPEAIRTTYEHPSMSESRYAGNVRSVSQLYLRTCKYYIYKHDLEVLRTYSIHTKVADNRGLD